MSRYAQVSLAAEEMDNCIETETSEIEILNENCLLRIFEFLPIADKFRIERVCKQWNYLSQSSWTNFRSLNFDRDLWGLPKDRVLGDINILKKIIKLSGKYLTSVDFYYEKCKYPWTKTKYFHKENCILDHKFNSYSVYQMTRVLDELKFVHTLTELYLIPLCQERDYSREILYWLESHGQNIVKFAWDYRSKSASNLAAALKAMASIKSLKIWFRRKLETSDIDLLSPCFEKLEELIIDTRKFEIFDITWMIRKMKKLRTIKWETECEDSRLFFEACTEHAQSLENVSYCIYNDFSLPSILTSLSALSRLKCLKKIEIPDSTFVDDEFLYVVAQNLTQLTHLDIPMCMGMSDEGISSLSNLPNLEFINIHMVSGLVHPKLNKIPALRTLLCDYCSGLKEEALYELLLCKNIELIFTSSSVLERNKERFIKIASEIVRTREVNKPLTIESRRIKINVRRESQGPWIHWSHYQKDMPIPTWSEMLSSSCKIAILSCCIS